ncbi:hypothetical protein Agub_g13572, partial [Astrephomene gubernaculifera]
MSNTRRPADDLPSSDDPGLGHDLGGDYSQDYAYAGVAAAGVKRCNCKKARCLKLYCVCFSAGVYCSNCACRECLNTLENQHLVLTERSKKLAASPGAFAPKVELKAEGEMACHKKGCRCRRSRCIKKYCECYDAQVFCSAACRCEACLNQPKGGAPSHASVPHVHALLGRPASGQAVKQPAAAAVHDRAAAFGPHDMDFDMDLGELGPHPVGALPSGADGMPLHAGVLPAGQGMTHGSLQSAALAAAAAGGKGLVLPYPLGSLAFPASLSYMEHPGASAAAAAAAAAAATAAAAAAAVAAAGYGGHPGMAGTAPAAAAAGTAVGPAAPQVRPGLLGSEPMDLHHDQHPLPYGDGGVKHAPNAQPLAAFMSSSLEEGTAAGTKAAAAAADTSATATAADIKPQLLRPLGTASVAEGAVGGGAAGTAGQRISADGGGVGGSGGRRESKGATQGAVGTQPHDAHSGAGGGAGGGAGCGGGGGERGDEPGAGERPSRRSSSDPEDAAAPPPPDGVGGGGGGLPGPYAGATGDPLPFMPSGQCAVLPTAQQQQQQQQQQPAQQQQAAAAEDAAAAAAGGSGGGAAAAAAGGGAGSTTPGPPPSVRVPYDGFDDRSTFVQALLAAPALLLEEPLRAEELATQLGLDAPQRLAARKAAHILRTLLQMAASAVSLTQRVVAAAGGVSSVAWHSAQGPELHHPQHPGLAPSLHGAAGEGGVVPAAATAAAAALLLPPQPDGQFSQPGFSYQQQQQHPQQQQSVHMQGEGGQAGQGGTAFDGGLFPGTPEYGQQGSVKQEVPQGSHGPMGRLPNLPPLHLPPLSGARQQPSTAAAAAAAAAAATGPVASMGCYSQQMLAYQHSQQQHHNHQQHTINQPQGQQQQQQQRRISAGGGGGGGVIRLGHGSYRFTSSNCRSLVPEPSGMSGMSGSLGGPPSALQPQHTNTSAASPAPHHRRKAHHHRSSSRGGQTADDFGGPGGAGGAGDRNTAAEEPALRRGSRLKRPNTLLAGMDLGDQEEYDEGGAEAGYGGGGGGVYGMDLGDDDNGAQYGGYGTGRGFRRGVTSGRRGVAAAAAAAMGGGGGDVPSPKRARRVELG